MSIRDSILTRNYLLLSKEEKKLDGSTYLPGDSQPINMCGIYVPFIYINSLN